MWEQKQRRKAFPPYICKWVEVTDVICPVNGSVAIDDSMVAEEARDHESFWFHAHRQVLVISMPYKSFETAQQFICSQWLLAT